MHRALPENAPFNATQHERNNAPMVLAAGERWSFARFILAFANGLRASACRHVERDPIAKSSRYFMADRPEAVAELIERHASRPAANQC